MKKWNAITHYQDTYMKSLQVAKYNIYSIQKNDGSTFLQYDCSFVNYKKINVYWTNIYVYTTNRIFKTTTSISINTIVISATTNLTAILFFKHYHVSFLNYKTSFY